MKTTQSLDENYAPWRRKLYEIIFEADTPAGKLFDVILLILILTSVLAVCLESVFESQIVDESGNLIENPSQKMASGFFWYLEWFITILFTFEYVARIICVRRPAKYIFSFFGIVDLLSILPTYASVFFKQGGSFAVLRAIRLLRVFRVLKLVWLLAEADELSGAIWKARGKVIVFLTVVLIAVTIAGAVMHELEPDNFRSIPESMYWAIVTMTTVGYGDLTPVTAPGKFCAALLILLGYSLIIVPTGFVSAEFLRMSVTKPITTRVCAECLSEGHDNDAVYCKFCGKHVDGSIKHN